MKTNATIRILTLTLSFLCLISCSHNPEAYDKQAAANPELFHQSLKKLTDVIVHDIFSPPVASRIYAYPNIAAYEVLIHENPGYRSLSGQLHELSDIPKPKPGEVYCFPLASIQAFLSVGKALIFSEDKMDQFIEEVYQKYRDTGLSEKVFKRSVAYGDEVADFILAWADNDRYKQTRTFPKFSINDDSSRWQPTPPAYMDAIEPHWNKIRTFVLDSSNQYIPEPPTPFSLNTGSQFYKELMEVYETGKNLSEEQSAIAEFWDCNPYVSHQQGHVMFATKKITPGGHWIGITSIATRLRNSNLMQTVEAYTLVSIALADAFISCWDEKYRSELIRPETVINKYIDESWAPLLQTPPFPEYTSGHSVISASAATTLTHLFGDNFHFVDSTEVEYGLAPRTFESFYDASNEAAISRLYGGIHYMPACEVGVDQGKKVGQFIINNLTTSTGDAENAEKKMASPAS
ncbi:vanadium-dependent haloperoxidase [Fulvivirgaceae bacterium BMA12]|uniref:Vanadium-dependent haloperoxidase n=1 Tax=Agaribacillus aureus TaxID=3051825 RepID=A0ABT8LGP6_9BACT|nr:vanadium-dependent haloperoxidase [Fulvivirgaceae bacterium BMA12]